MNLLPKRNLWVIKSVQVVRMFSTTGPKWSTRSDGTVTRPPPVDSGKKPGDSKENVVETMEYAASYGIPSGAQVHTPLPVSEGNPGKPNAVTPEDSEKQAGEFLTRYYGDQVKYFKKIARVNRVAMRRIKKLRKDWLKFLENHF